MFNMNIKDYKSTNINIIRIISELIQIYTNPERFPNNVTLSKI